MAGHSKWANTKHRKARVDVKRGKIFSKIAKELMVVARQGGGDIESNITLRTLVQKAKSYNMPSDNIDRAIKKGTGELAAEALEAVIYEGFVPGGIAVIVSVLTDNRNRSVSEVRNVFTKAGGNMAGVGAVVHLFKRKGQIILEGKGVSEEDLMEVVLESGGEDIQRDGECFEIVTEPNEFMSVVEALEGKSYTLTNFELTYIPDTEVNVTDTKQAKSIIRLVDAMEDLEDVQHVHVNCSIEAALLETLAVE